MSVQDFNNTLFELTDEMMALINPSVVMTAGYTVFKNMYAANPEDDLALQAFWKVAHDKETMIRNKDLEAMADVLREIVPMPGMVDDVWKCLSEENLSIVGDYINVLYDQASSLSMNLEKKEESASTTTMYSMYNDIWKDFLRLLEQHCSFNENDRVNLKEAREKMDTVIKTKGPSTSIIFGVLFPALEPVLPRHQHLSSEADIIRLCLPPNDVPRILKESQKALKDVLFPFHKKVLMSDLLASISKCRDKEVVEKLGTYWHYIRLLTVCVKECPPQILGMMNQMVALFHQSPAGSSVTEVVQDVFRRDDPAVLTK